MPQSMKSIENIYLKHIIGVKEREGLLLVRFIMSTSKKKEYTGKNSSKVRKQT